jgi:hypothetical protein
MPLQASLSTDSKKTIKKEEDDLISEALDSRSVINFDGHEGHDVLVK